MSKNPGKGVTYREAGIDIDAGEAVVDLIKPMVKTTRTPRVMGGLGGFAGLFRLDYNEKLFKRNYRDPVLVSCTDSVGSKMLVGIRMNKLDTVGIDCVAMSVNDMICCGAEPLFFLDYLAVNKVEPERCAAIIKGITSGCQQSNCALLGGETCEMPDVYKPGDFDIVGFSVGVVERQRIIDGSRCEPGDIAIGIGSDGLHANGYGLARQVLFDIATYDVTDKPVELEGATVGEAMLAPTRIYVKCVLDVLAQYKVKHVVKAMAHITGGGLVDNLPRVLPEGLTVRVKRDSWPVPPIFKLIANKGPVDSLEMRRVFNMGVGFVMIVSPAFAESVMNRLSSHGERPFVIGKVKKGGPTLEWN
ncbi:MAG: phosphoribosylformylglycinamidine cyclo-ligase [Planctomycetes bacterium]|jgi:phosphoribosylformylglycinamidine cyclo-ligase|nr:phosphoribosylformylglycinamidine cyclo-ligase [Planctomycetota bacterium]